MIAWVLIVLFGGVGNGQSSFAISGIASEPECQRLAAELKAADGMVWPSFRCHAYRIAKP